MSDDIRAEIGRLREGLSGAADLTAKEVAEFTDEQFTFSQDDPV